MPRKSKEDRSFQLLQVSMYHRDFELLDQAVAEFKARGCGKVTRSGVIRMLIRGLDPRRASLLDVARANSEIPTEISRVADGQ